MQVPSVLTLTIRLDMSTGNVQLEGPITDKILCYGMLERARDVVKDFDPNRKPALVVANGALPAGAINAQR